MEKVNEETIRRWIREGKLKAEKETRRSGYLIELESVKEMIFTMKVRRLNRKIVFKQGYECGLADAQKWYQSTERLKQTKNGGNDMQTQMDEVEKYEKKVAEEVDFLEGTTIVFSEYGKMAVKLLREHKPAIYTYWGTVEKLEEWADRVDDEYCGLETNLFQDGLKREKLTDITGQEYYQTINGVMDSVREILRSNLYDEIIAMEYPDDGKRPEDCF